MEADYVNHMGDDLMVANAARVSFNKERGKVYHRKDVSIPRRTQTEKM
jgi:hypothetical protein